MLTKRISMVAAGFMLLSTVSFAQEAEEENKLVIKPYGFVKGDMVYTTEGVNSFGANNLTAPQVANGDEQSAIGFTGQHTRLGFRATKGNDYKAGGVVEIDFFGTGFDANIKPRLRLAYASLAKDGFEVRMGQQWDLFSPNNATTNNTNGNMWFAGNRGFRRAQLQVMYSLKHDMVSPMLQLSAGETTREETGLGKDNLSGVPMLQGRLSAKVMKKYVVGVSFVSGQHLETKGTIIASDTLKNDFTFNTTGICVDFTLPIHKYFALHGEFNTGTNLNNANLFSVAGNHSWAFDATDAVIQKDKKSMGLWVNAKSNITDWFQVVVGYGMDENKTADLAANTTTKNTVIYGDLIFPIKHGFSAAVELQNIVTSRKDADDFKANVFNLSIKYDF